MPSGISLTNGITVAIADATNTGYLSSEDWVRFNSGIDTAVWGNITGTLSNQTDLQNALDAKQATLPNFTTGQILFGDGDNVPSTDSNLNWNNTNKRLGIGTSTPASNLHSLITDAATATVSYPLIVGHNSTNTPTGGFATGIKFQGQTSTTLDVDMGTIEAYYNVATHASRAVFLRFFVNDSSGNTELMRLTSSNVNFFRAPSTNGFGYVANSSANTGFDVASTTGKFVNGTMTAGSNGTVNIVSAFDIRCATTTTNGFGARRLTTLYTTSALNNACYEDIIWSDATHATRTSAWVLSLSSSGTMAECLRAYNGGLVIGSTSGFLSTPPKLYLNSAPVATSNYGTISVGGGKFDGSSAGFFNGNASGTSIAVNEASGYVGDLLNLAIAGSSKFQVTRFGGLNMSGDLSMLGGFIAYGASVFSGTTTCLNRLTNTFAPTATANYGAVSFGSGGFSGTAGHFSGSSSGTELAINTASGFAGNIADWQVGGVSSFKVAVSGKITSPSTITATGTTGNQTIDKPTGTVNIAAGGTTVTVTNNTCTTSSIVYAVIRTNDATAAIKNVVPAAGSFTINLTAAATAEISIGFSVFN